ncbi:helix-turn-helix transcriptional regulator [Streptomyces violaceus]|uniref:Helix-turn-helix domain-containing protein n=1 Tax=Streptomyces violaceus TaxID=1936 RepID=A0ABZ1NTI0_STRVL
MPSDATPDPYADPLVFGPRLQILRTRKGLTREQLGGLVGRSGSWVKGIETGRLKTPKLEVTLRIATSESPGRTPWNAPALAPRTGRCRWTRPGRCAGP